MGRAGLLSRCLCTKSSPGGLVLPWPSRRSGTLNGFGSGAMPVTVAGYRQADGTMAPYSGSGVKGGSKPDAAAVSDRSAVLRGVLTAGTFSGAVAAVGGTSVAAPQVTRRVWADKPLCTDAVDFIRDEATKSQSHKPANGMAPVPDSQRAGAGRLAIPSGWESGWKPPD